MDRRVISVLVGLGVLVALVVLAARTPARTSERAIPPAAWITLPQTLMDARDPESRRLLAGALTYDDADGQPHGDVYGTLAFRCGREDRQEDRRQPREVYIARMTESSLSLRPPPWRIELIPGGDTVRVRVVEAPFIAPSLPPASPPKRSEARISKASLEGIRQALSAPELWGPLPVDERICRDGPFTLLEACVDGRYFVSQRSCGYGAEQAARVLSLFRHQLPSPR
ncbi:hypothetical protein P6166_16595 [Stenotrophomonas sp. HITSZ_GD]|uniref:hypothetical protein n=1 Tax=Stenotrophomonas sp. HITSZ_GD TaxID=3037248 RepID=UPI00240E4613|nr:hypothetical protein [Stenotrophomonas sp. HITSZ_GD]MDG2526973.1 hypothetical protein [Stenotrophomonas sp. HITSZ_GD]